MKRTAPDTVSEPLICDIDNARNEIVRCARNKNLRTSEFRIDEPAEWRPHEVINPECGLPFTDISAWHFIADQAERGCPITTITMKQPSGVIGFVMLLTGAEKCPQIYIKVTLRSGKIRGRSFHNSKKEIQECELTVR